MATLLVALMAGVTLGWSSSSSLRRSGSSSLCVAVQTISLTLAWVYGFLVAVNQHGLLAWTTRYRRSSRRLRGCR